MELERYTAEDREAMVSEIWKEFGIPPSLTMMSKIHTVEGVEFTGWVKRENLMAIRDLEMKKDDILIVTFPKSGM